MNKLQPNTSPSPDLTRRMLVFGIPAALIGGSVLAKIASCIGSKEEPAEKLQPSARQIECTPQTKQEFLQLLQQKHPILQKNPYVIFMLEDEDVYRFLECCSLEDLRKFGFLKGHEQPFRYLNTDDLWKQAVKRNGEREKYAKACKRAKNEKVSLASLLKECDSAMAKFNNGVLRECRLGNGFSQYITPELMLAIFVQEIAPGEMPGKIKIKPKARLELFRMMCEAGWQPQQMPALYDSAISFGICQMTKPTHDGLQRGYHEETKDFIEADFLKHTSINQQVGASLLLTYTNLKAFSHIAKKYPNFMQIFETANEERRCRFLGTIIAAYHNHGNRPGLRKRIRITLERNLGSLEEYRTVFLQNISGLAVAYSHARNSGTFYSFIKHRAETVAPQDAHEDPEAPAVKPEVGQPPAETAQEERIIEDTLLVRKKPHAKTKRSMAYYTFTVPNIDNLGVLMSWILASGYKLDDVKAFQGVKMYNQGDIINVPLDFLPEHMRDDRRFARILLRGESPMKLMEQYMEGGTSNENRSFALLFGTNQEELRFPAQLLKE